MRMQDLFHHHKTEKTKHKSLQRPNLYRGVVFFWHLGSRKFTLKRLFLFNEFLYSQRNIPHGPDCDSVHDVMFPP